MKRIALLLGLMAALVSGASADSLFRGKTQRIFVSVQLTDGDTTLPTSAQPIAAGSTGTVYLESALPHIELAEKAKREKSGDSASSADPEEGITMLVTPTLAGSGQVNLDFTIRKVAKVAGAADAAQMAETEVKHSVVVKSGVQTTVLIAPAPAAAAQAESAPAAQPGPVYTVTVIAQKM